MIPKIVHYCWFGSEIPEIIKQRVKQWKSVLPDYEFILWSENNFDVVGNQFTKKMYEEKKYAFVADYVRLYAVEKMGGVYLDTDVLLFKSVNSLLENEAFFALEDFDSINTGIGFGAEAHNKYISDLLCIYNQNYKNYMLLKVPPTTVEIVSNYFRNIGFKNKDKTQKVGSAIILDSSYFCPQKVGSNCARFGENTVAMHEYNGSWINQSQKKLLIKRYIRWVIVKMFGSNSYQKLKKVLRK